MSDPKGRAKHLDESFDKILAEVTRPVALGDASGDWVSAREAKELVEAVGGVLGDEAIQALCRRAVIAVPVRAASFGRSEDPHPYIDRFDYFKDREPDLSHFKRTLSQAALGEILAFFELVGEYPWDPGNGVTYANWGTGDFKAQVAMDFSDVTFQIVGLQFDRLALASSIGDEPRASGTSAVAVSSNAGGRPARKHGEAISIVTVRLAGLSTAELSRYTAEAVGAELAVEYANLGEQPPHIANLATFGAGILRTLKGRAKG
jgi:hypothetical protein